MNERHAYQSRSHASEKEIRFINYEEDADTIKLRDFVNRGDVEVEIDGSLRNILSKDQFDVTIVNKQGSTDETTVSLGVDEVNEFLEMVGKQNSRDKPVEDTTDSTYNKTTPVYTSPYVNNSLRNKLPCLNPNNSGNKPGTPCLCQHCGMVGVLVESQKRPAIPHSPNTKFNPKHKKRIIDLRSKSKSETNLILLRELSKKIAHLENRISEQEERSVQKEYFKEVIQKMITQYSTKINEIKVQRARGVSTSTQYSKLPELALPAESRRNKSIERSYDRHYSQYRADGVKLVESNDSILDYHKKSYRPKSRDRNEERKGKLIASALEDKPKIPQRTYREAKSEPKAERNNDVLRLPSNTDDIKLGPLAKNMYEPRCQTDQPFRRSTPQQQDDLERVLANEIQDPKEIKKLCEFIRERRSQKMQKHVVPEKLEKPMNEKPCVDVAFMESLADPWPDDHSVERKRGKSRHRHSIEDKITYLKTLARRKNVNETELWCSILQQAKRHIKSTDDTVSIQLPGNNGKREMSELELTLSNLKDIVRRVRNEDDSGASLDLNYVASSHDYNRSERRRRK